MQLALVGEPARDHPMGLAAGRDHRIRQHPHQALVGAAIDEADPAPRELGAERRGRRPVGVAGAEV